MHTTVLTLFQPARSSRLAIGLKHGGVPWFLVHPIPLTPLAPDVCRPDTSERALGAFPLLLRDLLRVPFEAALMQRQSDVERLRPITWVLIRSFRERDLLVDGYGVGLRGAGAMGAASSSHLALSSTPFPK